MLATGTVFFALNRAVYRNEFATYAAIVVFVLINGRSNPARSYMGHEREGTRSPPKMTQFSRPRLVLPT